MIDKKAEMMKSQSLQVTTPQQQPLLQTIVNASANTSHVSSSERKPSETVTSSMEELGESDVTLAGVSSEASSDAAKSLAAALGEVEEEEEPTKEAEVATETDSVVEKESSKSTETSSDVGEKKETEKGDLEVSPQSQEDSSTFKKVRSTPSCPQKSAKFLFSFILPVPR